MMNYTIYADQNLIYNRTIFDDHGNPMYTVLDPVLTETTDAFCSLTYRAKRGTPAYNFSVEMIPRIKVYENGDLYWTGRILKSTPNINAEKEIYVEDFLGVLCDGIYRPFDFYGTVADLLQSVVDANNAQVSESQQIYSVVCDVDEGNISRSSEGYNTCWSIIQDKLLKMIGGYMWITYDEEERAILHYSMIARNTSTQVISFGKNLKTYNVEYDFEGFYTACVPLGAKDNETNEYVTIASVNDGKDYLIDTTNAARYGIIYAPTDITTWEDVYEPSNLLQRGQRWIQNSAARLVKKISLTAHDLSGLNANVRAFKWLDSVQVEADEIDDTFIIKQLRRPLASPLNIEISMGDSRSSLTGASISHQSSIMQHIQIIESEYVTNEDVANIVSPDLNALHEEMLTEMTLIRQDAESIISTALAEYVLTSDYETFQQTVSSQFEQLANSIMLRVSEEILTSIQDYNDGSVYSQFQEIYAFIRLIGSGVIIGTSDTEVKMKLVGDTLYFFTGNEETVSTDNAIAYFKSDQLVVDNSRIQVLSVGYGNAYMYFSVVGSGNLQCLFLSPRRV